jgi:hypothetical protein
VLQVQEQVVLLVVLQVQVQAALLTQDLRP